MTAGERGGEGASERHKMGATKYVLSSAILGLFWSSLLKGVLTNSTSRCDYPPCSCDLYGRLTCDCKEEGEVGSINVAARKSSVLIAASSDKSMKNIFLDSRG